MIGWTTGTGEGLTFVGGDTTSGAETVSTAGTALGAVIIPVVEVTLEAETISEDGIGFVTEFGFLLLVFAAVMVSGAVATLEVPKGVGTPFLISSLQKEKNTIVHINYLHT